MIDIFFITDKTNLLLKLTGWEMLTISTQYDPVNLKITIRAHLKDKIISTTQLPERLLSDDSINNQKKIATKLHEFAVLSYDHYMHAKPLE